MGSWNSGDFRCQYRRGAVVTELGPIADPRHAAGAHGVEILFVQGEIAVTEHALGMPIFSWGATGGTANNGGVVCSGLRYLEFHTAEASEMVVGLQC